MSMLVLVSGIPGTGRSTIAEGIADALAIPPSSTRTRSRLRSGEVASPPTTTPGRLPRTCWQRTRGSPTILIDGRDLFKGIGGEADRTCRMYRTERRLEGAPSIEAIRRAIEEAIRGSGQLGGAS
jgi:hypothetical protein